MEISRKWRFSCLLLGLLFLATTLQGVQGEVESEGPSESECRPYIEKALKELETAESEHIDPGAPADGGSKEDEQPIVEEGTTDDSEHDTSVGEDDTEKTESTEAQQEEQPVEDEQAEPSQEEGAEEQADEAAESVEVAEDTESEQPKAESQEAPVESQEAPAESQEAPEEAQAESQEVAAETESAEAPAETESAEAPAETESAEAPAEAESAEAPAEAESTEATETESVEAPAETEAPVDEEESEEAPCGAESAEATEGESAEAPATEAESAESPVEEQAESAEVQADAPAESAKTPVEDEAPGESAEAQAESAEAPAESAEAPVEAESVEAQAESAEGEAESHEAPAEGEAALSEEAEGEAVASVEEQGESVEAAEASVEAGKDEDEGSVEEAKIVKRSVDDVQVEDAESAEGGEAKEDAASTEAAEEGAASVETADEGAASVEAVEEGGASVEAREEGAASVEAVEEGAASVEAVEEGAASAEAAEEEGAESEGEASKEAEPEDELINEIDIPENLRPREQIDQLLKLDDSQSKGESILNRISEVTLRELKRLYEGAIKPLETLYKYRDLSNRHFGDSEIFSKPLVVFMGPWSGGKSSIINYLLDNEYNTTSLRTGAEPSPAYFNLLMHGDEPEVLDGTQLAADFTFAGLQKFGQGLEERLRGLKLPSKLLEKINIVEIPGILEVRKQVSRVFPFNDACQWFIDRADIIFLVYDPSKLDVGPETEAILDQLKGREHQTRIILNKADQVKPEELMRVQGALIWNISPLMSSAQPPVMYTTSLWSRPYEAWAPVRLLQAQERAFLRDLRSAVDKRIENKISSARRFAVRVRNHAKMVDCYLTTYYNHKSVFGNRKQVSDQIIEHPQDYHIYEGLSTLTNISRYDLPDPDVYRGFFRLNPLYDFQQLSSTCTYFRGCPINRLDVAIAYDLPEMVGKHKKLVDAALAEIKTES